MTLCSVKAKAVSFGLPLIPAQKMHHAICMTLQHQSLHRFSGRGYDYDGRFMLPTQLPLSSISTPLENVLEELRSWLMIEIFILHAEVEIVRA